MAKIKRVEIESSEIFSIHRWIEIGIALGYPICCVEQFVFQNLLAGGESSEERVSASQFNGENSGFIPCDKHSKKILKGSIKIEELIEYRECPSPFPDESGLKEIMPWIY